MHLEGVASFSTLVSVKDKSESKVVKEDEGFCGFSVPWQAAYIFMNFFFVSFKRAKLETGKEMTVYMCYNICDNSK